MDAPFRPVSPQSLHRSSMGMLPSLVGSPPRREPRPTLSNALHSHNRNTLSPSCFNPHMGSGVNTVAGAGGGGGNEACAPGPGSLQLGSPWSENYDGAGASTAGNSSLKTSKTASASSAPSPVHDAGGVVVPATLSPSGAPSLGGGGGGAAAIVDFSPTWDFAPGGAKLLICLAAPLDSDAGSTGPVVFFADRPVKVGVVWVWVCFVFKLSRGLFVCASCSLKGLQTILDCIWFLSGGASR